jgi:hypothetical protein
MATTILYDDVLDMILDELDRTVFDTWQERHDATQALLRLLYTLAPPL